MAKKLALPSNSFAAKAVDVFNTTHQALFNQANQEVARLERLNRAIGHLENHLLNENTMDGLSATQQITLLEVLVRTQQASIRNVTSFAAMLTKVRELVSIHDGVNQAMVLDRDELPALEYDNDETDFESD